MSRGSRLVSTWPLVVLLLIGLYVAWTPPLRAVLYNLTPLFFALTIVAAFVGLGAPLATPLLPGSERTDQILISAAFGVGMTGLFVFLPGILSIVHPGIYAFWILVGLSLCLFFVFTRWRHDQLRIPNPDVVTAIALVLIAVNMLQILPMLLTPVVSTDAMEYHLMVPKIALTNGGIHPLPSLLESHYPALASYVYLLVLPLAGDIACKGMHFFAGLGLLIAMARLVARSAPDSNRLLAPALYVTMPVAVNIFAWAWNDNLFALLILLGLAQLLDFNEDPRRVGAWKHLLVAGILIGLAAWTKYTIVMTLMALAPVLLVGWRRWGWKPLHCVALAAPIGLISLLVFVKNWFFTGNPFFPFLHHIFPSPFWNDASNNVFHNALRRWEHPEWHWYSTITAVFNISLRPRLIDVHTGVLVLAVTPFAFVRSSTRAQGVLKVFLVTSIAAWLILQTETRSLLVFLAVLLVVSASGLERTVLQSPRHWRAGVTVLALGAVASFWIAMMSSSLLTTPATYFFGIDDRRHFLMREAEAYNVLDWLNHNPDVTGAVLVGLKRPYYAEKPVWFSAFADIPIAEVLTRNASTTVQMVDRFRAIGASHIVLDRTVWEQDHRDKLYSWDKTKRAAFEKVLREFCRPVANFDTTTVYELIDES